MIADFRLLEVVPPGKRSLIVVAVLLPLQLVRRASELVNLRSAVERLVLAADDRQLPRRQHAERLRDIEHAQDVEEDRPVFVRRRRIDKDHFRYRWLEERGVSGDHPGLTAADYLPR